MNKGQMSGTVIIYMIFLLFIFSAFMPAINEGVNVALVNADPPTKFLLLIFPFVVILSILLIPWGMNRVWNFAFPKDQAQKFRGGPGNNF